MRRVVWGWILAGGLGCGGAPAKEASRFPPRPEGCDVHLFHETPDLPTANIGPVRVHCGLDVSEADCLRTLKDQVCKLGGDVVWGVAEKPELDGDENFWRGRAAHTGTPTLR